MTQNPAGANDQVVHTRGDSIDVGRADENPEGVVILRHTPGAGSRLREMYLAAPPRHDDLVAIPACARKA
jgi:hypothetical protein